MPTRPLLAPMLTVRDVTKAYEYFTNTLGFGGNGIMPGPDGSPMHADVFFPTKRGVVNVMLGPYDMAANSPESGSFGKNLPLGPLGNGVVLYFDVPNVDKYYAFIQSRGATIDEAPKDQFWGDRTISVLTPDNYYLTFASPVKGFKWPKEAIAAITGMAPPTAPGTVKPGKAKAKATKATKAKGKAKARKAKR